MGTATQTEVRSIPWRFGILNILKLDVVFLSKDPWKMKFGGKLKGWKMNCKTGAATNRLGNLEMARMRERDFMHDREAQARPVVGCVVAAVTAVHNAATLRFRKSRS